MSIVCLYHKNCMDGKAAAAVVEKRHPGANCFPMHYGDQLPGPLLNAELHAIQLYIVDFSLPIHQMVKLADACRKVIWIDHHKTAIEAGEELEWRSINVDTTDPDTFEVMLKEAGPIKSTHLNESGASLAWLTLFPHAPMPEILKYIKDRDIWQWKLGFSREVNEALRVRFPDDDFKGILGLDPRDLIADGKRHWDRKMRQVDRNCERAYEVKFHGHKAMAVNTFDHISETGERLLETTGAEIAIMYFRLNDKWIHSLRSNPPLDVSALAKKEGGGGHAQAAGFQGPKLHSSLNG